MTLVGSLIWAAIIALIWIGGGWASSRDAVCVSCHLTDSIHEARLEETGTDPHGVTQCVSCHETPRFAQVVTTAVPSRGVHFIAGVLYPAWSAEYGSPVANSACAYCHEQLLAETYENEERGIRVSHAEPLAAKARCTDCHVPQPETGVINRLTVGMESCLRCHDAQTAPAECDYCHTKDVGFAVQARGVLKPKAQVTEVDCGGCHSQESCDACHGMRMPHSDAFLGPGHARAAVEDIWFNEGRTCKRCHTDDRRPCSRCHVGSFPAHPTTTMPQRHGNADPYNNGCGSCHDRLRWDANRNFCGNCHEEYARIEGTLGK